MSKTQFNRKIKALESHFLEIDRKSKEIEIRIYYLESKIKKLDKEVDNAV